MCGTAATHSLQSATYALGNQHHVCGWLPMIFLILSAVAVLFLGLVGFAAYVETVDEEGRPAP
jgi:hypothetical protein